MIQGRLPFPTPLPFDAEDPVQAAVAWSGIIEPGDPAARILIRHLGQERALAWVFDPSPAPLGKLVDTGQYNDNERAELDSVPWLKVHKRWYPRAAELDVSQYLHMGRRLGVRVVAPGMPDWPANLMVLEDREPLALWVLGDGSPAQLNALSASLVGARASTNYGNRVAETFARDLTVAGYPVISGGAYGIDTAAHRGALSAGEGTPSGVAVLCGGVGNLYPAGNKPLFDKLVSGGLLISEVPPNWRPARWRFLERNRVIAALGAATIVVEAGIRSGAIATANRALELGRPVGAVPGQIDSVASAGSHQLLRDGADLITSSEDVISLMRGQMPGEAQVKESPPFTLTPIARVVWAAFPMSKRATLDHLVVEAGLSAGEVEVALLEMQLRGLVRKEAQVWERLSPE